MSDSDVPEHELRRLREVERERDRLEEFAEKYFELATELPQRLREAYERGVEASVDEEERRRERDELLARLYRETSASQRELAAVFEVSPPTVSRAVARNADDGGGGCPECGSCAQLGWEDGTRVCPRGHRWTADLEDGEGSS